MNAGAIAAAQHPLPMTDGETDLDASDSGEFLHMDEHTDACTGAVWHEHAQPALVPGKATCYVCVTLPGTQATNCVGLPACLGGAWACS